MAINMICHNGECRHYWENCCRKNLDETIIEIDEDGNCKSYEKGVCDWYYEEEVKELDKLKAENAELKARLEKAVELPCKVGDTIWFNTYKDNGRTCIGIHPHIIKSMRTLFYVGNHTDIPDYEIGKSVFLSREECNENDITRN